jgi:membrane protein DedA with SNARE-associated domain/rhodanese-related sulfurtransferase
MPVALEFFVQYGYLILFLWVLTEQLGVPLPSVPLMLTAGALSATHRMSIWLSLLVILLACALSDSIWYFLGRRYGGKVLRLLCRLSLEASTCVRKTENYFGRHGATTLVVSKFVPGLSTVAAPIAGQTGMSYGKFLGFDMMGTLLWGGAFIFAGRFFGDAVKRSSMLLHLLGQFAVGLFFLLLIGFLAYRIFRQQQFLKKVSELRLEADALKTMMDEGAQPYIVDLRHPLDYLPDPRVLPGAVRIGPSEIAKHIDRIPRDRDVVLYCTCPSEETSARVALNLQRMGVDRVRPLRGGFDGWKQAGYPLEEYIDNRLATGSALPV